MEMKETYYAELHFRYYNPVKNDANNIFWRVFKRHEQKEDKLIYSGYITPINLLKIMGQTPTINITKSQMHDDLTMTCILENLVFDENWYKPLLDASFFSFPGDKKN